MPQAKPSTMSIWIRELADGVIRVGGKLIENALKEGKLTNREIFFNPGTSFDAIMKFLKKRGVSR